MFFIFPWQVDVPRDRWPVVNWLIILATVGVFWLQLRDFAEYEASPTARQEYNRQLQRAVRPSAAEPPIPASDEARLPPGITGELILHGWTLKGLFGYMWLHGGLIHLIGNMWFLWLFGNAVCAKLGNLAYLPLYILVGIAGGIAHLLAGYGPGLGASGAINGIIGMYTVLFYQNEITCYFIFWPLLPYLYVRQFAVSSVWMIAFWLFWDILHAFLAGADANVGYFAHVGGFAAGFGITFLLCRIGWITMEEYEKSLWQAWQEWRHGRKDPYEKYFDRLTPPVKELKEEAPAPAAAPSPPPKPIPMIDPVTGKTEHSPADDKLVIVACACGKCIRATRQYAGKLITCPHCKAKVQVPGVPMSGPFDLLKPPATTTSEVREGHIRFRCHCGKGIKVPSRYAGRSGKCPRCGARIRVPRRGVSGGSA